MFNDLSVRQCRRDRLEDKHWTSNERGCSNTTCHFDCGYPTGGIPSKCVNFAKKGYTGKKDANRGYAIKNGRKHESVSWSGGKECINRNVGQTDTSATIEDTFDRLSTVDEIVCSDCGRQGRYFLRARAVGTYDGVLRELIRDFKFYGRRDLAEGLGVLMAREVSREIRMRRCNVIVPVPLHPLRLAERGYNQAELLANEVGFCFGIRVQDSLARITGPGEQNKLGRQLRKNHVRGVFTVPYPAGISGKRVILADDVITTGNTANECARALLRAGAAEVHVIAAAISPFEQEWLVHQGNETGAGCVELAWREQV